MARNSRTLSIAGTVIAASAIKITKITIHFRDIGRTYQVTSSRQAGGQYE